MDMPENENNAIVLQTAESKHIGFTLFNPHFNADRGDCVFVIVPLDDEILNTQEVDILTNINDSGEHQWERRDNDIIVSFEGRDRLKYSSCGKLELIPEQKNLGVWLET